MAKKKAIVVDPKLTEKQAKDFEKEWNKPVDPVPMPKRVPILKTKQKKEIAPKVLPKYDLFVAPLTAFDWDEAGVFFNPNANGFADLDRQRRWNDLLALGYDIQQFAIDGNRVYFLLSRTV